MTRLGNRERHLLLSIELLDDASRPIKSDAIVGEVQQALAKQQEREKQQREKEHAEKKKQPPPPTPLHLQVRHYSVHMGICLMRTPFSDSARVRAIIPTLRPNGGVWTGALGFGVKWVLETCLVVTNKSAAKGAKIDMGGVEFESDEGEEGATEA